MNLLSGTEIVSMLERVRIKRPEMGLLKCTLVFFLQICL